MAGNFIQSSILEGSSDLILARGCQPDPIARQAGIPLQALSDPDLPISVASAIAFFELAAQQCDDRCLGLSMAANARLASVIGPVWILLRNARTVGEMCEAFSQNFDLFSDAALLSTDPQPDGLLISWSLAAGQANSEVQGSEYSLALIAKEIRSHIHANWMPQAALFRHAKPRGSLSLHRAAFGNDIRFNQACNGLLLDKRTLDTPLQGRNRAAQALASRMVDVQERISGKVIQHQVESVIRNLMPYAPCSLAEVSHALDLGPRTLQKRLKQQGLSFVRIRDTVRADLASKYLAHSDLSVSQVAEILGYNDATSLSRSFRRWKGCSIRQIRKLDSVQHPASGKAR